MCYYNDESFCDDNKAQDQYCDWLEQNCKCASVEECECKSFEEWLDEQPEPDLDEEDCG